MASVQEYRTDRVSNLLHDSDPAPVAVYNASGTSPYVLTCEHAGRLVPRKLGNLGIDDRHWERHIAWDIGAERVARMLAEHLDAPVIVQRYSRLVVDCNRPLYSEEAIPEVSDGTEIPANLGISDEDKGERIKDIHEPYHDALATLLDDRSQANVETALVAVHSFTPSLEAKPGPRPWDLGILHNRHDHLSRHVHDVLETEANHLEFTFNEPYRVNDHEDYTIPVHGEKRGIPHTLLEIRNDHISEESGQREWAELLNRVFKAIVLRL
ncbi:MAG: N-formylglutamate amidohydrolase [Rhodospirillales bacterium]|jgi:predicted N-formylglutamate amidohydrolase|nr:N-formylglutamate amidohydrolase [Rhodospirillales bacterium]MBT4627389.1 N-formylglutamate amidohydrolase [Rhodospirillales bacterium]MBT5351115.1 N-formylglutamate amidohydrolase [Rhodospirillales bacterium]MBT6109078.1 N-formylglutamate amidohydrolase [Rhodospirillales bacterium]MBT7145577.1 N-formylglutamate amidohydrolase [Rhodospirillales bacterium]